MLANFRYPWLNVRRTERLWTPLDLGQMLPAWWNADDHGTALMTDDGDGLISSWADRISGVTITGATTARPTWGAAAWAAGKAGVTFDGVANVLNTTSFAALPTGAVAGGMWLVVNQPVTGNTSTRCMFRYGGTSSTTVRSLQWVTDTVQRVRAFNGGTSQNCTAEEFIGQHIVRAAFWTTNFGCAMNGSALDTTTGAATLATGTVRAALGATNGSTAAAFFNGTFRHALVTRLLQPLDVLRLEGWLAHDGGLTAKLPALHRFKSAAPTMELTRIMSFPGFTVDLPRAA